MKTKDVDKINKVWQDKNNEKVIDEFKKTEKIINRISEELKKITAILDNDKKEGENKNEIK